MVFAVVQVVYYVAQFGALSGVELAVSCLLAGRRRRQVNYRLPGLAAIFAQAQTSALCHLKHDTQHSTATTDATGTR